MYNYVLHNHFGNEGFDEEFYDKSCELYGDQYLIPYLKGNS